MLMTKEQAVTVWCPMVRLAVCSIEGNVVGGQAVLNRLQKGMETACPDSSMCIADKCAMWRWGEAPPDPLDPMPPQVGFCGLAGRPA